MYLAKLLGITIQNNEVRKASSTTTLLTPVRYLLMNHFYDSEKFFGLSKNYSMFNII